MIVVGIHNTGILSSAAVVVDGQIEFGCAEERLDRNKYSRSFPHRAIQIGLDWIGAELDDIDCFAVAWNPALNISSRYRAGFSEWPAYPGARFYSNPNQLLPRLSLGELTDTEQIFHTSSGQAAKITYVTHHLAHSANAYWLSGFDEAAILSVDAYGERATTVWAKATGGKIEILREIRFPHSLGSLYSAVTEFLGFRPDLDEWKVMGAAAYGDPARFRDAIGRLIHVESDGSFQLDLSFFNHFDFDTAGLLSAKALDVLGEPRSSQDPLEQQHLDLAAALQEVTEKCLFAALEWLADQTRCPNLCMAGGVVMNSVFNGRATLESNFDRVYIPFAPDDSGNSIGAALWVCHQNGDLQPGDRVSNSPYLGRSYDDDEIRQTLEKYAIKCKRLENVARETADLLAQGQIVGWFQSRMEFGQRALGSRSILADPREASMKDRINSAVKYRESFRPFAPSILLERSAEYFEVPRNIPVPYMERVFPIRSEKRDSIPAVVHADGSGRLQTVDRDENALFYDVIADFERATGVPVVLNTSFNLNGEPIVESPTDAIRCFFSSGMDALVLGPYLVVKQ